MIDEVVLALGSPQKTVLAGRSLASTLYRAQAVYLTGDVGAGKTTFLQGLSEGFSLLESVSSPTFALARPHADQSGKTAVTHVDLYRLDPAEAATFMRRLTWDGVLWVEWADRLDQAEWMQPSVHVHLADAPAGRTVTVRFMDVALPSPAQIETWRRAAGLPPNIIAHCETVGRIAEQLGRRLLAEGRLVRPHFLRIAGQ
jgi:tRNA threonylcarbamoyladenosine biosynthesis protein TsaE